MAKKESYNEMLDFQEKKTRCDYLNGVNVSNLTIQKLNQPMNSQNKSPKKIKKIQPVHVV